MALTKDTLYHVLINQHGMKRDEAKAFIKVFFEELKSTLEANEDIKLPNFGSFKLRNKPARPGRNPKTGEPAVIAPRRVVTFKAGPALRESTGSQSSEDE